MGPKLQPRLSVVVLTDSFATIRDAVEHLRAQIDAAAIELVVGCPSEERLALPADGLAPLARVAIVETPLLPAARARAATVRAARAPVVVLSETHVFADPAWAGRLLRAHEGPWVAVAPGIGNANPEGALSWVGLLMDYGRFPPEGASREVADVSSYNGAYKREALLDLGDRLESLLEPGSALYAELRARGHRFLHEPAARIDHLNVSRPWPWLDERYLGGRLFGATRRRAWSRPRTFLYAAGSPLVAPLRLVRTLRVSRGGRELPRGFVPALALACVVWAIGEFLGYVLGAGPAAERRMLEYELHKERYVGRVAV